MVQLGTQGTHSRGGRARAGRCEGAQVVWRAAVHTVLIRGERGRGYLVEWGGAMVMNEMGRGQLAILTDILGLACMRCDVLRLEKVQTLVGMWRVT